MKEIGKKIKTLLAAATGTAVFMFVLGLIFVLFPGASLGIIQTVITWTLIAFGVGLIVRDFMSDGFGLLSTSFLGVILLIMGIIFWVNPESIFILTVVFGIYMIASSISKISIATRIKNTAPSAASWSIASSVLSLICGIIMVTSPMRSMEIIMVISGVTMMIYGLSGVVDMFVLRSKVSDIESVMNSKKSGKKSAKKIAETAEEAEVVEKKK